MSGSHLTLLRYRLIDERISNKMRPFPSLNDLIDYVGEKLSAMGNEQSASRRTIQKDIENMRHNASLGYLAPIEYDIVQGGYYYTEPDFTISKLPLNQEEKSSLEFIAHLMGQYEQIPVFSNFKHVTQKIFDSLNIHRIIEGDKDFIDSIQFDQKPVVKGGQWLGLISESLKLYRKLSIHYQPFNLDESHHRIIHPYILKEFKDRWYLIGFSESAGAFRTYALDRIEHADLLDENFPFDTTFDKQKYFEFSYGIYNYEDQDPENVVLKFKKTQAGYIKTKPLHPTQEILEENDNELTININVFISEDLIMELLSFGPQVEILKPKKFRRTIKQRIKESLKLYK